MEMNRYKIEESKNKHGYWVCTDIVNGIVCIFEDGKFNETHQFTILEDIKNSDANKLALIANEMDNWLRKNHYDKMFYNIRIKFGKNLKRIRTEKKLSVRILAVRSGLSKSSIENIEQARFSCNLDTQYKIATGLGIDIKYLFD